jgi:hypothetical protein
MSHLYIILIKLSPLLLVLYTSQNFSLGLTALVTMQAAQADQAAQAAATQAAQLAFSAALGRIGLAQNIHNL